MNPRRRNPTRRGYWAPTLVGALCFGLFALGGEPRTLYRAQGMGKFPAVYGGDSLPEAINDAGEATGDSLNWDFHLHAFYWRPGEQMRDLGDLPGGRSSSHGYDINELGHICGTSSSSQGGEAFLWTPEAGMIGLGDLPGESFSSRGLGMNDNDDVVGYSQTFGGERPFLWTEAHGMEMLPTLTVGGTNTSAWAINNKGEVVGTGESERALMEGFIWDRENGIRPLGFASKNQLIIGAIAINEHSQVACQTSDLQGCLWDPVEGPTLTGFLPGNHQRIVPYGLNDHGVMVGGGQTDLDVFIAFIWDKQHGLRNLSELIDAGTHPDYRRLGSARDINNNGWIVARGYDADDAILLTPFVLGDMNCDGSVNVFDIEPFVLALIDLEAHAAAYPGCHADWAGDINQDGSFNGFDVDAFVELLAEP
ncbi:MAG: hypothetical protein CHACPFDD_00295 [Phycisphaerae bacterium]|nr:hypothetical protein [Phycisphaerae bacterium]